MLERKFDREKNLQLIDAAANGNLEKVKRLIEDPTVDINFIRSFQGQGYQSSLTIAIKQNHLGLAIFLLRKGVLCDAPSNIFYDTDYKTVLACALELILKSGTYTAIILLKDLLLKTKDLHSGDLFYVNDSISKILERNRKADNYKLCASLYLNEIVMRCDMNAIESFFASNPAFVMTADSFREYLEDYEKKPDYIKSVSIALDFLVERGKISNSTCHEMKETLVQHTSACNLTVQIEALQKQVTEKDKKIAQLTAELAALKSDKSREEFNPRWFKTMSF